MKKQVSILMGSDSDWEVMQEGATALDLFGIAYEIQVMSAHRTPDEVASLAKNAAKRGIKVFIAGAGAAAHLAGAVAANTTLPVIGVPLSATSLNGLDALLSTVQMPAGVPVATVSIGKSGARNAGIIAAQILALADKRLTKKIEKYKKDIAAACKEKNKKLQDKIRRK